MGLALSLALLGYLVPSSILAIGWRMDRITLHGTGISLVLVAAAAMVALCAAANRLTTGTLEQPEASLARGIRTVAQGIRVVALVGVVAPVVVVGSLLLLFILSVGGRR